MSGADLWKTCLDLLHREARLLDEERWRDWLALFDDDARYWMGLAEVRQRRDGGIVYDREAMALFDDSKAELGRRIDRFEQPTAWAEDPPTRSCHVVSNVEVEDGDEILVRSVVTLHRVRNERETSTTVARRRDRLVRREGNLLIGGRDVFLLESVLLSKNINTFL